MQHISEILPRTIGQLPPPSVRPRPAAQIPAVSARPGNLRELVGVFESEESRLNPDATVPLRTLTMTEEGTLVVPDRGTFAFTEWSRKQCASLLGMRWDRWFENANPHERADELNRRFARAEGIVKVRTRQVEDGNLATKGELMALVSPGYTPIADSRVARLLVRLLAPSEPELRLVRYDSTDQTVSYVVKIGEPFRKGGPGEVGEVWGGLLIRNSGVGYASLMVAMHLTRLLCKNGMVAPVENPILIRRRHRGATDDKLTALLVGQLDGLRERLGNGLRVLHTARERHIDDVPSVIRDTLRRANLPMRLAPSIQEAFEVEPSFTAFGVSQAITLAAQRMSPEVRVELERAASSLLTLN